MKTTKVVIFAIIVLTVSFLAGFGKVEAVNPPIDEVLRIPIPTEAEPNPNLRYFTNNTGKAIYLTGSHTWANLQDYKMVERNHPDFDYAEYLNFLVANNHNFIRLWITTDAECDWKNGVSAFPSVYVLATTPKACVKSSTDDGAKYNLTQINPAFLNRLRERVAMAQEKGIYVSIMLFDSLGAGYAIPYDPNDSTDRDMEKSNPFRADNNTNGINADTDGNGLVTELHTNLAGAAVKNIQKEYVKKVVETVNNFDNVLYEIGNELPFESFEFQKDIINYIHDLEAPMAKKHPVGITPVWLKLNGGVESIPRSSYINSPADWISPSFPKDFSVNVPLANSSKVNMLDTDHGGNPRSDNDSTGVWKAFLRGYNYIYMDIYQLPLGLYYEDIWIDPKKPLPIREKRMWNDPVGGGNGYPSKARRAMGNTKAYADKMDLNNMIPIDSDTTSICSSTHFCLAKAGSEYLVYQPKEGSTVNPFSVNLPAGTYKYEWFHPLSGKIERIGSRISTGGSNPFSPPFAGDAVLYLTTGNVIVPQCADGIDNDGDGKIDSSDPRCKDDPNYNDEKDAIPEQPGLVGHWQLDEPAGSAVIKDASIYGNDGMNHGAILGQPGVKGSASYFDGLEKWYNYMEIEDPGDNSVFDFEKGESITISAWIRPEDLVRRRARDNVFTIIAKQDSSFVVSVHTPLDNDPVNPQPTGDTSTSKLSFSYRSPTGTWNNYFVAVYPIKKNQLQHIAVSYKYGDPDSMKIYINGNSQSGGWHGVLSGSDTQLGGTAPVVSNEPIWIGHDTYQIGKTEEWHGMIDDVRIYNEALSKEKIQAIYSDRKNPDCADGADNDNDSYFYSASSDPDCGTQDCNDGNAAIYPGAMELCADGVDNDCDSLTDANDSDCKENNGLVARWKLDGNAADSSGKNNNGSLSAGMDCAATGRLGQSCAFNGNSNFINVPDSTSLRLNKDLTIASWVKWDGAFHGFDWSYIMEKGQNDDDNYAFGICGLGAGCNTPRLFFEFTDATTNTRRVLKGSKTVAATDWLHATVVYDSAAGMLRFYQNGVLDSSVSVAGLPLKGTQTSSLSLGKQNGGLNLWFSGLMDDTRIYNRVLATTEIASLANPSDFDPADINNDTHINIKDIQICIKAIIAPLTIPNEHLLKCQAVAPPIDTVNIKDIQEIIRKIITL